MITMEDMLRTNLIVAIDLLRLHYKDNWETIESIIEEVIETSKKIEL